MICSRGTLLREIKRCLPGWAFQNFVMYGMFWEFQVWNFKFPAAVWWPIFTKLNQAEPTWFSRCSKLASIATFRPHYFYQGSQHRLEKIMIFDLKDQRSFKWSWSFAWIRSFFVQWSDLFKNLDLFLMVIWSGQGSRSFFISWSDLVNDLDLLDDLDLLNNIEKRSRSLYYGTTKNFGASRHKMPCFHNSINKMDLILSPSSVSNRIIVMFCI